MHKIIKIMLIICIFVLSQPLSGCGDNHAARPKPENTLDEITTGRIAVPSGTRYEKAAKEQYPNAQFSSFQTPLEAFEALKAKEADYLVGAYTVLKTFTKHEDGLILLTHANIDDRELVLPPDELKYDAVSIVLGKGNIKLRDDLSNLIKKYKNNGTMLEIIYRWINDNEFYVMPNIQKRETGNVLRVAVALGREPMLFKLNGSYAGIDYELINLLAYDLKMQIEFIEMPFADIIPAVVKGEVDAAISNIGYTDERAEIVEFTEPYLTNPQAILVREAKKS